jgi:hypothetical protein
MPIKLEEYKKQWEKQKPEIETKGGSWLSIIGLGEKGKPDSTKYNKWNETQQKIESAMRLRELIRELNFAELKKQNYYSPKQNVFKETVTSYLDSALYQQVRDSLNPIKENLNKMDLNAIAAKINPIVDTIKKNSQSMEITGKQKGKADDKKSKKENTHSSQENLPTQLTADTDNTKKIRQYLQGDTLQNKVLEEYKQDANTNTTLKASINLCLKFWTLVKKTSPQKDDFTNLLGEIKKDETLKQESELVKFLNLICKDSQSFTKFRDKIKSIRITNSTTLNELKK